jgi:hypothetical protein
MTEAESTPTPQVMAIPLDLCEPLSLTQFRFTYGDVDALADSIFRVGQLQPGRAIGGPDGKYLVYVGQRRLAACRKSREASGRPTAFLALVDEKLSDAQLFATAYSENRSDRLERRDLHPIEEAFVAYKLVSLFETTEVPKVCASMGWGMPQYRERSGISSVMSRELAQKIFKVEEYSGFVFSFAHLAYLCGLLRQQGGERVLLERASSLAYLRAKVKAIDEMDRQVLAERKPSEWFYSLFPEYREGQGGHEPESGQEAPAPQPGPRLGPRPQHRPGTGEAEASAAQPQPQPRPRQQPQPQAAGGKVEKGGEEEREEETKRQRPPSEHIISNAYTAACPSCKAQVTFSLKGLDEEVIFIDFEGVNPQKERIEPEEVIYNGIRHACPACGKEFLVSVSIGDIVLVRTADAAEPGIGEELQEEKDASLVYDDRRGCWAFVKNDGWYYAKDGRWVLEASAAPGATKGG